ncbi:MAG TPA: zinc-dependent metalloprotease [Thermomicrobiales bacterium]|nr:zinc-dependent metalloprotease [Thermomicrobiales bacterium]
MPNSRHLPSGFARTMIGAGLFAGAAVGAIATARARGLSLPREQPESVANWQRVQAIATSMNRTDTLSMAQRTTLDREYRILVERCLPLVSSYMQVSIPSPVERTFAFDRVDWINANIEAFRNLLAPIDEFLLEPGKRRSVVGSMLGGMNRQVVSGEMGVLLGYLSRRVLGQYDLALIDTERSGPGKLYFVQPNIEQTEATLALPADQFRLWLALHETTHVFQFEGFAWVRPYFQGLLHEYFEFLKSDLGELRNDLQSMRVMAERVRTNRDPGKSWLESLMTEQQRDVFYRIQALMCIIEGYSNHVMNAVGKELMVNYDEIATRFAKRQRSKGRSDMLLARLTGLDVKLEQYRLGEEFIDKIVGVRGPEIGSRLWSGPEFLPTMEELHDPQGWLKRAD